jgi:hypothetical protein
MAYQTADMSDDPRIAGAMKLLRTVAEADSANRREALEDLKFSAGDQWPVELQNSRNLEARPCLTINKVDAYVRQVCNQQRQQRPRIKVHPTNTAADAKVAQVLEGITRHIEVNSNADAAYDHAFEYAVRMGWGYWRIVTDYVREDSFEQEIFIQPIDNPFTVYFDPHSTAPDGSDAEQCLVTSVMSKTEFRAMYPDADDGTGFLARSTGDANAEWIMREDIRVAEYFHFERKADQLLLLSDGTRVFASEAPSEEVMLQDGVYIVARRPSVKKQLKWCKLTALQVLEERDLDGRYIPVVPVYGMRLTVEDKRKKIGLVRYAKDPQRMYNFWRTSMTESVALAPKAKWLLAEGQDEGHETEWAQANTRSAPVLRYKQTDIEGRQAPPPTRLQPEPPPQGVLAAAETVAFDLQTVIGIMDPSQLPTGNISGKALSGQQQQIDMTNFHFYDNLTRSIRHTGKIILDLVPYVYSEQRVMRIIGADGQPDLVTINERVQDAMGAFKVVNDVTVGEFDVVMDTGPGYQSKRMQAVEAMLPLLGANEQLFQAAGDLVFRNMDFPGADVIADRLAAVNPLAQIDEKSDVPPQVQMQLAQSKAMIEDMQQQLQAMQMAIKTRQDVEGIKQEGADRRMLMQLTSRAHNTDTINEARANQTAVQAIAGQNKAELDAMTKLILAGVDLSALRAEIQRRDIELAASAVYAEQDVGDTGNPFIIRQ